MLPEVDVTLGSVPSLTDTARVRRRQTSHYRLLRRVGVLNRISPAMTLHYRRGRADGASQTAGKAASERAPVTCSGSRPVERR